MTALQHVRMNDCSVCIVFECIMRLLLLLSAQPLLSMLLSYAHLCWHFLLCSIIVCCCSSISLWALIQNVCMHAYAFLWVVGLYFQDNTISVYPNLSANSQRHNKVLIIMCTIFVNYFYDSALGHCAAVIKILIRFNHSFAQLLSIVTCTMYVCLC